MNPRRYATGALRLLLAAVCGVYVVGAFLSTPYTATSDRDFDLVRSWRDTGRLTDHPTDPTHLTKPGQVALLRGMFPHGRPDPASARRFLLLNALLMVAGIALAVLALERERNTSALLFLSSLLVIPQLRDASDYVASEAVATGLVLLAFASLVLRRHGDGRWAAFAGSCIGLLLAFRPNDGAVLLVAAVLLTVGSGRNSITALRTVAVASLGTVALIFGLLYATGYRSSPGATTRVLLWGTADYYWLPDVGGWPTGRTPGETARLQWSKVVERSRAVFRDWGENQRRSLEWRALHGLVSSEELPPRWRGGRYQKLDRGLREWWWLAASILTALATLTAVGGAGPYRHLGLLVIGACVFQSLLFGADPRLALPLLPLLAAGVAAALPSVRWSTLPIAACAGVLALLIWRISRVPDAAGYDFALVRGAGRRIDQPLRASWFPANGGGARVQFRLNEEEPYPLGFRASIDGTPALERKPGDPSLYPAFFSVSLDSTQAAKARSSGSRLSIESTGPPGSEGYFYFPLTPPIFGPRCRVDGAERVPSGFGGTATGGLPVWVTSAEAELPGAR